MGIIIYRCPEGHTGEGRCRCPGNEVTHRQVKHGDLAECKDPQLAPVTHRWTATKDAAPSDSSRVRVITEGGAEEELFYSHGLWFLPDRSMYVYYTPAFWRYL